MISVGALLFLLVVFLAVIIIGVSIPMSLVLISALFLPFIERSYPLSALAQKILQTFDRNPLFAIFFFVVLGNLLLESKMSDIIVDFVNSIFGKIRGGLAVINIVSSTLFGALTGAITSTIAAIGGVTIPAMKKRGYDVTFATAVATASGINGAMIPPSINGLTYAIVNNLSVAYVFMATLMPGVIYCIALCITAVIISKKRGYGDSTAVVFSLSKVIKTFLIALPALIIPVSLFYLIYGGIATPTESGALAISVALVLGFFWYKSLDKKNFRKALIEGSISTGVIMFIIAASFALSYVFSMSGLTNMIAGAFLKFSNSPNLLILVILAIILALGMILDPQAIIIIFAPLVSQICLPLGMDPIHLSGVFVFAAILGCITPPVGTGLATGCAIGGVSIDAVSKELLPFFCSAILVLLVITYVPKTVLWMPMLLGYTP